MLDFCCLDASLFNCEIKKEIIGVWSFMWNSVLSIHLSGSPGTTNALNKLVTFGVL